MHPTTLNLADSDVTTVRVFGTTADIVHRIDQAEHARRQAEGLAHVDSLELLDVLTDLPAGAAIPVGAITPSDLRVLRDAPPGVIHATAATVTRLLVPAITPLLAVVHASCWRDGVADASEFGAYLPRMLVTPELSDDRELVLAEAAWYGIGVAVGPPSNPVTVLEPDPVPDWQPTVAWWRFCERVYSHRSLITSDVRPRKETRGRDLGSERPLRL